MYSGRYLAIGLTLLVMLGGIWLVWSLPRVEEEVILSSTDAQQTVRCVHHTDVSYYPMYNPALKMTTMQPVYDSVYGTREAIVRTMLVHRYWDNGDEDEIVREETIEYLTECVE